MRVELGRMYKDRITGFEGIAISRTEWVYGCVRVGLQSPELDKDGKPIDAQVFDEAQVVAQADASDRFVPPPPRPPDMVEATGGDRPNPGRRADPT